jgi:hypothetical protein
MEEYLKYQLNKIKKSDSQKVKMNTLNCIYAYLESRGYKREDIKKEIDKIILNKIKIMRKNLAVTLDNLK